MKWFRSNMRLGSRLGLCALAVQFLLTFGHFHGNKAPATLPLVATKQSGLHNSDRFASTKLELLDEASFANVSGAVPKTSSGDEPSGQATDPCAICAVMALANAMVTVAAPYLVRPEGPAFLYLLTAAGPLHLDLARTGFQSRGPPIC
jgi:hypothetical protein